MLSRCAAGKRDDCSKTEGCECYVVYRLGHRDVTSQIECIVHLFQTVQRYSHSSVHTFV